MMKTPSDLILFAKINYAVHKNKIRCLQEAFFGKFLAFGEPIIESMTCCRSRPGAGVAVAGCLPADNACHLC